MLANMVREWRNLKSFMRAGRGHSPDGISKTAPGGLAVLCRACPHPGINVPEDCLTAPPERRYLYRQTIAVDCNFRLKNRHRATNNMDVCLSPGLSYFVERKSYMQHVKKYASETEVRVFSFTRPCTKTIFAAQYVFGIQCYDTREPEEGEGSQRHWSSWGCLQSA